MVNETKCDERSGGGRKVDDRRGKEMREIKLK